ncbi:23S rRNA (adenine(1618)-N(6))-methyltransferase [Aureococcus anophagefferens]|nr:23S rRNA (adenine(1618)-N(6))-methyltransferase [Aureococcus anophagefferens]
MQAATILVLIFSLYLLSESAKTPNHGAVFDDDGAYPDAPKGPAYRGAVVDGGSGKTAVSLYECALVDTGCAAGSVRELPGGARFKADVAAVAATPYAYDGYLDEVSAAVGPGDFSLSARFATVATLEVLSGDDEADLEHAAGVYAASLVGVDDATTLATLSGGGLSAQVTAGDEVASLDLDLFAAQKRAAETGDEAELANWRNLVDAEIEKKIAGTPLEAALARAEVALGLSMHATAAATAGVAGTFKKKAKAIGKIEELVRDATSDGPAWRSRAAETLPNPYGLDDATLRRATLYAAARAVRIADRLLPDGARVYFSRTYGAPPVTCDWSLGMFLDAARRKAAELE